MEKENTKKNNFFKKLWKQIQKIDRFCMNKKVYTIFVLLVVLSSLFVFRSNFFLRKTVRNSPTNTNYFSLRVDKNLPLRYTFEAKYGNLSKISFAMSTERCVLSSSDKAVMNIYKKTDPENPIFSKVVYLYSPKHETIDISCSNLSLNKGEMYFAEFQVTSLADDSRLYLKMHNVNSFNQLGEEDVQGDIPVGYSYIPNIVYTYSKLFYPSMIPHALIFLVFIILFLFSKIAESCWYKEIVRAFYIPLMLYAFMEILNTERFDALQFLAPLTVKHYFVLICAFLIMQLLYLFFYSSTGRGWIGMLIVTVLIGVIGFVSHTKIVMRGDAFVPWDIYAAGMAATIGSKYYFPFTINFVYGILYLISVLILIRLCVTEPLKGKKERFALLGISVMALSALSVGVLFNKALLKKLHVSYALYPPLESYNSNGTLTAFVLNLNNLSAKGSTANTPEAAKDIEDRYLQMSSNIRQDYHWKCTEQHPNVICIMSESYGDLRNIREFETSEPVMPYYDSIMNETIHGKLCVSIFAGGTCNTEFEFLTGCTVSGLLAGSSVYTFYVNHDMSWALPNIYRQNGYETVAIHPFDPEWWDRETAYPLLGFDRFISQDDFVDPQIVRRYISDQSAFERIVNEYENKAPGQPIFEFCVTMQNHADYSQEYDNMAYDIHIMDMDQDFPYTEQYLSLLRESDDALRYLIEYFRNVDEPTIIVFFGDHYPTLDNEFYDTLLGTDLGQITAQESLPLYQTPYFVWANYDIHTGNGGSISPNFLGQDILDLTGIESPSERACLKYLNSKVGAISALAVYDRFGDAWVDEEDIPLDIRQYIRDYNFLQYDLIYNRENEENSE
ncbi:MAG: sulfatase-like hydrolase/transferase [Clostridiales bacterium]|nr:sulfatase-like hydrolase/transferase [Clostridiales bacterium]